MLFDRIVTYVAAKAAGRQLDRFLQATRHVQQVQDRLLETHLRRIAGSDFAETYRLGQVEDYRDFVRTVPVLNYEDHRPFIERLKRGDLEALFNGRQRLIMFALTSGTTSEPKFIPVTRRFVQDYRRGWNVFGLKVLLDHPGAFRRKIVQATSSAREQQTACGLWAGAITGLLAQTQKWIVRRHYTTPLFVSRIKDPIAKAYVIMRLAVADDVAFISTANPATTLRLAQVGEEYAEPLIRDVATGQVNPPGAVPGEVMDRLKMRLRPDRAAGRRLEQIMQAEGRLLPKDYWNLSFLANWTGGTLGLYLSRFAEYFGDTPVRDLGLLASEGRFSIPVEDHTPAGILEITSNLVEFIPEQEYGRENPPTLRPWQVEAGQTYYLVFSNATGLTRYDIGDAVRVVDFYHRTPIIEFLHKGAHVSSVAGEKVTESQVVSAVRDASRELGCTIEGFVMCPHWADVPYYALTVEIDSANGRTADLAQCVDRRLSALNIEYKSKRESARLGPVRVQLVHSGYFQNFDLQRIASDGRSEQYKHKYLYNQVDADRDLPLLRTGR